MVTLSSAMFIAFAIISLVKHAVCSRSGSFLRLLSNNHIHTQEQRELNAQIKRINQFMTLKSQNKKLSYWYYTGTLRSTSTGREIVGIEGIEIVSPMIRYTDDLASTNSNITSNHDSKKRNKRKGRDDDTNIEADKYKVSYLSNKVFVYVDRDNRTAVVEKFRLRPSAPLRDVKYMKRYHELVTIGIDYKNQLYASTEYPSQRTIKTRKISINDNVNNNIYNYRISSLEKILFSKETINIANFMSGIPRRYIHKWISFSSNQDSGSRGRSQEYYTLSRSCNLFNIDVDNVIPKLVIQSIATYIDIKDKLSLWNRSLRRRINSNLDNGIIAADHDNSISSRSKFNQFISAYQKYYTKKSRKSNGTTISSLPIKPSITMNYQRYGECPSFFAADQSCCVELHAVKLDSLHYLPANIVQLISNTCNEPTFLHDNTDLLHRNTNDFHRKHDLLKEYLPWYSSFNIFSK